MNESHIKIYKSEDGETEVKVQLDRKLPRNPQQ